MFIVRSVFAAIRGGMKTLVVVGCGINHHCFACPEVMGIERSLFGAFIGREHKISAAF
jgi:hypothetical protein